MRKEMLFGIYKTIVGSRACLTRNEIAEVVKASKTTVCGAVRILKHAGLIKEHYIEGKSRFGGRGVCFEVLDTDTSTDYEALLYGEDLSVKGIKRYIPNESFPIHDNIRSFVSEAESAFAKKEIVSVALITNSEYNAFCSAVIPEYIAKVRITREEAALRMRRKYFDVKLQYYLKKT